MKLALTFSAIFWVFVAWLCSGCGAVSSPLVQGDKFNVVERAVDVNYLSAFPKCDQAFSSALNYYRSHGVAFNTTTKAKKMFTCLPCPPALVRLLPSEYGLQRGNIAYARMCGNKNQRTKLVIHELGHLLGLDHTATGIMTPTQEGMALATGFSNETIKELKNGRF